MMVVVGFESTGFQMLNNALQMSETDPAHYGRVMSLTMLAWGSQGLTSFPYGVLADAVGERAAIATMGVAVLGLLAFSISVCAATRRTPATPRALRKMPLPAHAIASCDRRSRSWRCLTSTDSSLARDW